MPETDHWYTSTACQHGSHGQCRQVCKFCQAACLCACHRGDPVSAEPKPLTEAERTELEASLRWHFGAHAAEPGKGYASLGVENALIKVARIVAAREAAARRGAENDPKHALMYRALLVRAEKAETALGEVEAQAGQLQEIAERLEKRAAKAEAAVADARREALLEAAEDLVAELVCCDVYERLSDKPSASWAHDERGEYQCHSICYWGSASAELVRKRAALAEPERDEEGS